jgi:preprotein translocase subunit SecD
MIKTVVIVATVLICIFGIIGFPRSVDQLKANLQHNIHLGLDLSGGSHLVLQVQVQDAAKTQADQVIEALRDETRTQNIVVGGFDRNDPQSLEDHRLDSDQHPRRRQTKTQAFRNLIAEKYPDWILTPVSATDYRMNMKPTR